MYWKITVSEKSFHFRSTIHKDVSERLRAIDPQLYGEVKEILDTNKAQRHIRGGMATQQKYRKKNAED